MAKNKWTDSSEEGKKVKITRQGWKKLFLIFRYIIPYKGIFVVGCFFLVLSNITIILFPVLIGQITKVLEKKSQYTLNQVTLVFLITLIFQVIFSYLRIYTFSRVSEKSIRDIRTHLYEKMISLPLTFFEKSRVGELMSRISADISQLQDVFSITLAEFFRQIFTLIVGVGIIVMISWKLTLFMLATFPVLVLSALFFGKKIRQMSKDSQDHLAKANIIVEETLAAISIVKSFVNERYEVNRYKESLEKVIQQALLTANYRGGFVSFVIFAIFGSIVSMVWYGGQLVLSNDLLLSDLLTFLFSTAYIGGSIGGLGDIYSQIQRTIGASERVMEILNEKSEFDSKIESEYKPFQGKVSFEKVSFSYPSRPEVAVLSEVSFTIEAGKKVALVGPSGVGKSTIIQLLSQFYRTYSGKILIDNQDISTIDIYNLRKNIGIVPQDIVLFGGTIKENIAYGKPNSSDEEIIEAAKKANTWSFISKFPDGLETLVGERGVKLSGGQRQRIAIARAILKNPTILILDEATSALDSQTEIEVQEALNELMKNRTTLIIAHRLATIRQVDAIFVLVNQRIVESGTHEELVQKRGNYYQMLTLQTEKER